MAAVPHDHYAGSDSDEDPSRATHRRLHGTRGAGRGRFPFR